MTIYTIYLPPEGDSRNQEDAFRLVPDCKAKLALFFPPFWLAWQRLWIPLLIYFIVMVGIALIASSGSFIVGAYLSALPGLYLLLEGYELVRQQLERNGWRFDGIIEANNLEEAEIRYMLEREERKPVRLPRNEETSPSLHSDEKPVNKFASSKPVSSTLSLFPE